MPLLWALVVVAGGLEMPPLDPLDPGTAPVLALAGPLAAESPEFAVYAFGTRPYGFPGLRYLGAGVRMGPWAVAVRQFGNALFQQFRVSGAVAGPKGWLAGGGLETVRFGTLYRQGVWLEGGGRVLRTSMFRLDAVGWFHSLVPGYRWAGLRLFGRWDTGPWSTLALLGFEPEVGMSLAWHTTYRIHRLLTLGVAYRSEPPLVGGTLWIRTRPALLYTLVYHPDLGISHTWGLAWAPAQAEP